MRPLKKPTLGTNVNRMLKNILSGIGSVLVIAPSAGYSHYRNEACGRSDIEALRADVRSIGVDFQKAVDKGQRIVEAQKSCS